MYDSTLGGEGDRLPYLFHLRIRHPHDDNNALLHVWWLNTVSYGVAIVRLLLCLWLLSHGVTSG